MASTHRPSPCCHARSIVRGLYLDEGVIVLRCSKCHRVRIDSLEKPTVKRPPHLRLIVSR